MYVIVMPLQFLRQARKFLKKHPDLHPHFANTLDDLQKDPLQPLWSVVCCRRNVECFYDSKIS